MSYPSTAHPDQQYPVLSSPFIFEAVNLSRILSRSLCVMCFSVLYPQLYKLHCAVFVLIFQILLLPVEREVNLSDGFRVVVMCRFCLCFLKSYGK